MVEQPRRGEVYWTDFDPALGSEIGKRRPALVVQNDAGNETSSTTIVAAISSRFAGLRFPFLVRVPPGVLPRPSVVNCAHIRTVDKSRLHPRRIAFIESEVMQEVDEALRRSLGLY